MKCQPVFKHTIENSPFLLQGFLDSCLKPLVQAIGQRSWVTRTRVRARGLDKCLLLGLVTRERRLGSNHFAFTWSEQQMLYSGLWYTL